ncbi:MAG: NAD(P)(+) transhydrogenase (Re/Si-specific) subunit beta [Flavobacteriales bacterium]
MTEYLLGNLIAAGGMGVAIIATIFLYKNEDNEFLSNYIWIFGAMIVGTIIGWVSAKKVAMTAMPQMVSMFNGMGGACAALIGLIEFPHIIGDIDQQMKLATVFGGLVIGSVSFSGSMVAFAKLNGNMKKDIRLPYYNIINILIILAVVGLAICLILHNIGNPAMWVYILCCISLLYGIMLVIPIGGADMPVVISLLNSFTGLAAAFGGFLYSNMAMLTGGILVGSAGTILTVVMCHAMNRSLVNVIFGGFGGEAAAGTGEQGEKTFKDVTTSDAAILMNYANRVIIVPGYGLAVAQAQHAIHDLEQALIEKGVEVKYAIHPVAGRMPGHMNVLLAESNVEYDKLVEMEDINSEFSTTDVVFVVGANDVVNPAAKEDPASEIYGMPILNVNEANSVIVNKRSMNVGYAGIDNELFYKDGTSMLFGDAKGTIEGIIEELKGL